MQDEVLVQAKTADLPGILTVPDNAAGLVIFAHGSGSSRHSPRNQFVATQLNDTGLGTLLFDLLTAEEDKIDQRTRELRFNIPLLSQRMVGAVDWTREQPNTSTLPIGLFGASTGAAAALVAASQRHVGAIVSRGGRPDLAGDALPYVEAPTLFIVGGNDKPVIELNQQASEQMQAERRIEIVPGASHLFQEPGKLERVAELSAEWFRHYLST